MATIKNSLYLLTSNSFEVINVASYSFETKFCHIYVHTYRCAFQCSIFFPFFVLLKNRLYNFNLVIADQFI